MWKDLNQKKKWTVGNKVRKKAWNKQDVNRGSRRWVLVDWTRHVLIFQKHAVNACKQHMICRMCTVQRTLEALAHEYINYFSFWMEYMRVWCWWSWHRTLLRSLLKKWLQSEIRGEHQVQESRDRMLWSHRFLWPCSATSKILRYFVSTSLQYLQCMIEIDTIRCNMHNYDILWYHEYIKETLRKFCNWKIFAFKGFERYSNHFERVLRKPHEQSAGLHDVVHPVLRRWTTLPSPAPKPVHLTASCSKVAFPSWSITVEIICCFAVY